MDSELEEYLSLFKSTSKTKVSKHSSSRVGRVKPSVKESLPQLEPKPSYSPETETVPSSDELLTSSPQKNLNIYNLQELSDTSSLQPDDNSIRPSEDTTSGIGNLVFSLKDLAPSEATLEKSKSETEEDTSLESFNIKANIFTVDDLGQSDNVITNSSEGVGGGVDKSVVSERLMEDSVKTVPEHDDPIYKDDFEDATTYKEDIEGTMYKDDFEDTTTCKDNYEYKDDFEDDGSRKDKESADESVDECIEEEEGQVSSDAVSFTKDNSGSYGSDEYSSSTRLSYSGSNADTTQEDVSTSNSDELSHTTLYSEDSSSRTGNMLKTEVAVQTDPWHMTKQLDALLSDESANIGRTILENPKVCGLWAYTGSGAGTMALHNLITQQLELTRSLIATAQSLHHCKTVAIQPNYHYVTLEDTKKFIKENKPKVLKRKKKKTK